MKKALGLIAVLLVVIVLFGMLMPTPSKKETNKPLIVVSTFSLYDVLTHLARDRAEVVMIVPFGVDVHAYEPTPKDMIRIEKSDLFVFSGAGLEPWTDAFGHYKHGIDMSRHVFLLENDTHQNEDPTEDTKNEMNDDPGYTAHAHHGTVDPHYWLDIDNMLKITDKLEEVLLDLLEKDAADDIHAHAVIYRKGLQILDGLFQKRLASCRLDTIVVSHNAFGYLAKRYGFDVAALSGLSPDAMPSAKTMAKIADLVQAKKLNTVFYESFVSDQLIQSIAKESGARVEVLQPLANITAEEAEQFQDYKLLMNINLQKLRNALECR